MKKYSSLFNNPDVERVFNEYPEPLRQRLLRVRSLIFEIANNTYDVGQLEETLKWGQPAYVIRRPRSGSTIRIDAVKGSSLRYAIYFICTTNLIERFRERYPDTFKYLGNRAISFELDDRVPIEELSHCLSMALTYHLRK